MSGIRDVALQYLPPNGDWTTLWTGAALPVTVRLRDGNVQGVGTGNSGDTLDIQRPGSAVNLGMMNTKGNFAKNRKTVTFNATMTAAAVTVNGVPRTVVTVSLGTALSGANGLRTAGTAAALIWTPTTGVTTPGGSVSSSAPVTEPVLWTGTSESETRHNPCYRSYTNKLA